jgi:hypothetical protein
MVLMFLPLLLLLKFGTLLRPPVLCLLQPLLPALHLHLSHLGGQNGSCAFTGAAHRALPVSWQVAVEHELLHLFICAPIVTT